MLVDRKPFLYVWRPFYRFFHDRVVVHYLERLRLFFFAESYAHWQALTVQSSHMAAVVNQIERQVSTFESNERARWAAFEQLYLYWLSDPDRNARFQMEQLVQAEKSNEAFRADLLGRLAGFEQAEKGNEALRADLRGRLAAFEERNTAVLDRLGSMDVQNRNLLETLIALDRNHRALSTRLDQLEAETRLRWHAMEQFLTTFLSDPDRSTLANFRLFRGAQEHHESAAGGPPSA